MPTPPRRSGKDNEPAGTGGAPEIGPLPLRQDINKLLHDLRNPLTPLVTGIEILRTYSSEPQQHRILDLMQEQVQLLTTLLNDFDSPETPAPTDGEGQAATLRADELAAEEPSTVRSVLIIDDNPNILASLKILFEERGYGTLVAMKAEDAIALAENHRPAICLCDISLPTLDGFETAAELRKVHARMLMFSMSGFDSREDREQSKAVGFLDHFRKPFVFDEVLQIIENYAAVRSIG